MKKIRLTESDIKKVIYNSVSRILKEDYHIDNFTDFESMEEEDDDFDHSQFQLSDLEERVLGFIEENEADYDMLQYPDIENISSRELASCVTELIEKARNGEDVTSSIGYNTITVDGDTLYLENDDTGDSSEETWAGDIFEIITNGSEDDLDYIVDTIASSINQCWFETHEDEMNGQEEDFEQ